MPEMTPYERTIARMAGQPVDRLPNQNIFMSYAAHAVGATYDQLARDYRILVAGNLCCAEMFHLDWVSAISDPVREAAAFGAEVVFAHDGVPACRTPFLASYADWSKLALWDPWEQERTRDRLLAIQRYREKVGGYYPIVGWIEGAAASAAQLRGVAAFLEDTMTEPQAALDLLDLCAQTAIRFALAQLAAGADMIGLGDAVCSLMSPRAYRVFGLPYEQRIIRAIHDAGGKVKLHICGNTTRHLADMAQTGADIVDVDWMVPYAEAIRVMRGVSVNGNFDPVGVLLQGTAEQVAEAVRQCHAARDERSMISAGCETPVGTPAENLLAHYRVLVEAGA